MEDIDIAAIAKGKVSIAEALKQIESVGQAFKKASQIEQKLMLHDSLLSEIKSSIDSFTTFSLLNSKLEEFSHRFEKIITAKFEEFTSQYMIQLNDKANQNDMETMLSSKVSWMAFTTVSQQVSSVKAKLDKHIMSEFEGFKTKIKLELDHKANEKRPEDELNMEEIHQLKARVTSLEQKVQEMFMDENLEDSEDYDSQEAMDNMIDDFDKRFQSEEGNNEGDDLEEPRELGPRFHTPSAQVIENIRTFSQSPPMQNELSPRSENVETAKTEVSEENTRASDLTKIEGKVDDQNAKEKSSNETNLAEVKKIVDQEEKPYVPEIQTAVLRDDSPGKKTPEIKSYEKQRSFKGDNPES